MELLLDFFSIIEINDVATAVALILIFSLFAYDPGK